MKNKETLARIRESPQYRQMFREIIKSQIQTLVDQLAYTGEESVLVTVCFTENDIPENTTVGTELGLEFLNNENVMCKFREYCLKKTVPSLELNRSSDAILVRPGKRKFSEVNGEDKEESSEAENSVQFSDLQNSVSFSPSLNTSVADDSRSVERNDSGTYVPKGYSKCSMCNYMSKFKANVTRHERGVHRINLEGAPLVTVQYACALCDYKSTYRSNVMRHEKSLHKLNSTTAELESRKVSLMDMGEDPLGQRNPNNSVEAILRDGNQLYLNQTGIHDKSSGNQSFLSEDTDYEKDDVQVKQESVHFDTEAGTKFSHTGNDDENYLKQSTSHEDSAQDLNDIGENEEGCHICNHCHKIFKSLSELRKHIDNTHFTPGNFVCEKCDRSFNTEFSLEIHTSTHNTSKQEVCGCGKAFQYRTSLIRHERKCEFLKTSQENLHQGKEAKHLDFESGVQVKGNESTQNSGPVVAERTADEEKR